MIHRVSSCVCVCVCVLTLISLAGVANATPLTNAVASYNASADDLQTGYNNFISAQEAAYEDFQAMCDNLGLYFLAGSGENADDYWDAYLAAEDDLQGSCSALDTAYFNGLLPMLADAANKLQLVINIDASTPNEVAYVSGTAWFDLPSTPFLFWKDEGTPPFTEFVEFEFPQLAVGDPQIYTSYSSAHVWEFIGFIQDLQEWIRLFIWFNNVKDLGTCINTGRASEWDSLCQWCLCYVTLLPEGWTNEEAEAFCYEFSSTWSPNNDGLCESGNQSDRQKAQSIRECFRDKIWEDIEDGPIEAIDQYMMATWDWDFAWEQ